MRAPQLEACRLAMPIRHLAADELLDGPDATNRDLLAREVSRLRSELERAKAALEAAERLLEEKDAACETLGERVAMLEQQALTDPLTGLGNRRSLWDQLAHEVQQAEITERPFSILFVDIDHFKRVNDSYGHMTGDIVLRQVAQLLRSDLRSCDVVVPVDAGTITLARFGGEEFVIVLPDTPIKGALVVAERIRALIGESAFHSSDRRPLHQVTVSVGVAQYTSEIDSFDFEGVIERADSALYEAKEGGRDCPD